jgi:DNA-binding PadR family transcriptional regulator
MKRGYNETKALVLSYLARVNDWRDARELASAAGWKEPRSMASYLHKLRTWGLLFRRPLPHAEYKITSKGRERLRYLRSTERGRPRLAWLKRRT